MPELSSWDVSSNAVWREHVGNQTISLRHPTYPAEADCDDAGKLKEFVAKYVDKVASVLGLPSLFHSGSSDFKEHLAWLPYDSEHKHLDPRHSFDVRRYKDPLNADGLIDRSVVFVASEARDPNKAEFILGSRLGIRIVTHLSPSKKNGWHVRITSIARSQLLPEALVTKDARARSFYDLVFDSASLQLVKTTIRQIADLHEGTPISIDGVRVMHLPGNRLGVEIYATASRPEGQVWGLPYALTLRLDGQTLEKGTMVKLPLVTHAVPPTPVAAKLFTQDPPSLKGLGRDKRPNRSGKDLAAFTQDIELAGISLDYTGSTELVDDLGVVDVLNSRLVDPGSNEGVTQTVKPANAVTPRMDAFTELSAYEHLRAKFDGPSPFRPLFDTIMSFGLPATDFFRFASTLLVRHRAGIHPGPGKDGKTINAQVTLNPVRIDLIGQSGQPWTEIVLDILELRFALADLTRTTARRDLLGLADDPRWSWHEYCHVLLAGWTGRLEFHFSHSAGDSLAAIACDPSSKLADDPRTRGYTFPWVYLSRRHDRSVFEGWGWCGRYHRPALFHWPDSNTRLKGYETEQILATSMFRLYRALGGDDVDDTGKRDPACRQRAADYTLYLIMRAIRLMPAYYVNILETADQLVTNLIDADIGTWPASSGPLSGRVGGCAYKVVRWAFEAQGLYATTDPLQEIDAPGLPPKVDVFIDTGRPDSEGNFPRGGYMPVSLDWHGGGLKPWHAACDAIKVENGTIQVNVSNRGQASAAYTTVTVWYAPCDPASGTLPDWNSGDWSQIAEIGPQDVPARTSPSEAVPFGPFPLPNVPSGSCLAILAIASCPDDLANTDPSTALPSALVETPLTDLVAGDNNLGLRIHEVP
jgi:hypothetical protein